MKVLQVGLSNNPGGVEAFAMNYFRELQKKDVIFDFVCMYGKIAYEDEIQALGGQIFNVPNVKTNYFGYKKEFLKILENENYDAVHVNMLSAANMVPLRLAHRAGVKKVIAHSHNASAPGIVRNVMHMVNRGKISRYANVKAACGKKAAEFMFGERSVQNGDVHLMQNAVDIQRYLFFEEKRRKIRELLGWENKFVVGHVGRFEAQKNHAAVIEIFREVLKTEPDAKLCLVGDGEFKSSVEEKVRECGLTDSVYFAGVRTDVENYLSAMDVFLMPSLFEGLPFALVEAQANGLPCVVSDTISREAFLTEKICVLSLQQAYHDWAECIVQYQGYQRQDNTEVSDRLERAHFDIKVEAGRLKSLYQE